MLIYIYINNAIHYEEKKMYGMKCMSTNMDRWSFLNKILIKKFKII